jgi:hypothetical protein
VSYEIQPTNNQECAERYEGHTEMSKHNKIHDIFQ